MLASTTGIQARSFLLLFLPIVTTNAATIVWDGDNDPFWGKGNNWQGPVPTAADDVVFDDTAVGFTVNLGSESRAANSLTIDSATAYSIVNQPDTPTYTLTVGHVTVSNGTGHVIHAPVVLSGDAIYSIAAGADLTLEDSMSGTHSLTKTGGGQLILGSFSESTGDTIINAGSVLLENQSALRYRSVTLNVDGGLETNGHLANIGSLAGSGDFDTNDAGVTVGFDDTSTTYSGTLTSIDNGSLNESIEKIGDGTWTLTGTDYNIETGFYVSEGQAVFDGVNGYIREISGSSGTDITFSGGASLIMEEAYVDRFTATDASTVAIIDSLQSSGELIIENDARLNVTSQFRLNGGSLIVDGGKVNLSGTLVNDTPGTIQLSDPSGGTAMTFDLATDQAFDDVISDFTSGSGSIFKKGDGDLTLNGANTHSGNTTISDGRIVLGNALALQNSTVVIGTDDALHINGHDAPLGGLSGSGALALGPNTITVGGNDSSTSYDGVLSGVGGLNKDGAGILSLGGDNTFSGSTAIDEGAIFLVPDDEDINTSLQNTTVSINVDNGLRNDDETYEIYIGALEGSGDYDANGAYVVVGGNNASTTYSGNLTDEFLALNKEGSGTWTLSGDDLRMSQFFVNDGAVVFDGAGGSVKVLRGADQAITLRNGTNLNVVNLGSDTIRIDRSSLTVGIIDTVFPVNTFAISDPDGGTALTFNHDTDRVVASTITDDINGPGSVTKAGAGDLTLTSAHTHTGVTTISDGRIVLGNALALQNSTVSFYDDALDLNGHNATLGGLAGSGALNLGTNTLTVGGNDASTSYDGILSGTGGLIKTGTGTLSVGGNNPFTGDTVLNEGAVFLSPDADNSNFSLQNSTVTINADNGLQNGSLNIVVFGALAGSGDYDGNNAYIEVGGNHTSTIFSGDIIRSSSIFDKKGTGTLTLAGSNIGIGEFIVTSGTVTFDDVDGQIDFLDSVDQPITFQNGTDLKVLGLLGNAITVDRSALTLNALSSAAVGAGITISDPDGGTALTLDLASNQQYLGVITDHTSGPGSIEKLGTGTLTLLGDNTYTGGTTITAGTLQLGNGGNGGTSGSILGDVSNEGTLIINRSVDLNFNGEISGSGALTQLGTGDLTLTNANTHTGPTTISDGRIVLGNALALQNSTVSFDDDGLDLNGHNATLGGLTGSGALNLGNDTITVGGNDASTSYDGILSGSGGLIKEGTGTLSLGGDNPFAGDLVINKGALFLSPDADGFNRSLRNSIVTVNLDDGLQHGGLNQVTIGALAGSGNYNYYGSSLVVGVNNASTTFSGNLTGTSADIRKEGTGTWTLEGNDVFMDGDFLVIDGTVIFDGARGTVSILTSNYRPLTFQNGTDIQLDYLYGRDITIDSGAAIHVNGDFFTSEGDTLVRSVGDGSTLDITGTATLAGTIQVRFPDGYTPPIGTPLTLATFGGMGVEEPVLDASALPAGYACTLEVISNGATSSLALVVGYANTVDGFRLQYGIAADGSEDGLDDSGNGIANILYFAFGLGDPAEANIDRNRLPAISSEAGTDNIVFTYVRPTANDTGLEIDVMTSDNLVDWHTPDELGFDFLPLSETTDSLDDENYSSVTQVYPIQIDEDRRFYRLDIKESDGF